MRTVVCRLFSVEEEKVASMLLLLQCPSNAARTSCDRNRVEEIVRLSLRVLQLTLNMSNSSEHRLLVTNRNFSSSSK